MHSKWKDLLLAVMLVAVLALPAGLVGAEDKEGSTDTEDAFSGSVESDSELLTVERVDASEVAFNIGEIDMIDVSDTPFDWTTENSKKDLVSIGSGPEFQGIEMSQQPLRGITDRTRASDDERNQDYYDWANASVINSNGETLQGSLTWSSIAANQDMIDWYKIGLSNVATTAGASPVKNITMTLKSFTATSGSMYELRIDDTNPQAIDLYDDYGDVLNIYAIYTDDMFGDGDIGGFWWYYDDLDDNDGWTYDENWTLSFNSPRHSWGGPDNDGFANRLTEVGWIYIGVALNYYRKSDAPQNRPTFTSSYEIDVDTSRDVTVLNAGNHWKNATAFTPLGVKKTGIQMWSDRDDMDWWKFEGTDNTKLWNVSMQVNRTSNVWAGPPTTTQFWDNWLEIAIVWRTDGADDQWGTADDRYTGVIFTMSYIFSGGGFIDDTLSVWLHNNWTEAPDRTVWLGLQETPIHGAHQSGQVLGFYLPDHTIWSTYDLTVSIGEVKPNVPPEITEVTLESDFAQDPSGGYYDSEFVLTVTYQDEDDDPPKEIWVYIDKDTPYEKANDISGAPTNVFDHDYWDGKEYKLEMLGEDLTDEPFPHTVHVRAVDDIPSISIRDPAWSELFNFEAGVPVWDDEPVTTNLNWQPFEELQEDDPTTYFPLESIDGMFKDPENKFEAFYVWNLTSEEWADSYDTTIAFIEVVENDGIWQAAVTPKHNENGKVNVKFQAEDLH
ncbi:MAG: hypothetical protein ACMUFK_05235, partial [Thermoplasmatota archaeon]